MTEFVYNTKQSNNYTNQLQPFDIDLTYSNNKTEPFSFENSLREEAETLASRLVLTAQKYNSFIMAANQCGKNLNVFCLYLPDKDNPRFLVCFNPEIKTYSQDAIVLPESDFFNNNGLQLKIKRPANIVLTYKDYSGTKQETAFHGLTSRMIQHTIDRLNGIDFKSKLSKFNLTRQLEIFNKKVKRYVKQNAVAR